MWRITGSIGLPWDMCCGIWSLLSSFKRQPQSLTFLIRMVMRKELIALNPSSKRDTKGDMTIEISDDSGLVVGSPLFLQDFHGR